MSKDVATIVFVVREGASQRRSREILRWIRCLVPAALIVVSSVPIALETADDVVTLRAEDVDSGPLAVADALGRAVSARS